MFDYAIIGGGIIGLATAMTLGRRDPDARIIVFEKESTLRDTRVDAIVASYTPAFTISRAATRPRFAREGSRTMVGFCREHGIKHDVCGKVIVATKEKELPLLENLFRRGLENGLSVTSSRRNRCGRSRRTSVAWPESRCRLRGSRTTRGSARSMRNSFASKVAF